MPRLKWSREPDRAIAPTPEAIKSIARKHGFPPTLDLVSVLEDRWLRWHTHATEKPELPAAESRRVLREVAKRAAGLAEAVDKMGQKERRAIRNSELAFDARKLTEQLNVLRRAASWGAGQVQPSRRGARGDVPLVELLCKLYRVWIRARGRDAPRISNNLGKYGGGFFEFASDVLKLFGVRKGNGALGKMVIKAMRIVD